jgi:RNA polymerase sigma factor (sigma-70 family)
MDDAGLLSQYVSDRSEDAFRELVNRHLNLVYSAALRQVGGDTHKAQDVVQTVFADLARKASSVARHPTLSGWLYSSTHFAAAKVLRSERRRQHREQKAHMMESLLGESGPATNWEQLRPVLDDVMHELGARQRTALVLRFFEQRPTTEISRVLGLTERGVRKNLDGSLERLRIALRKRGIDSTTAALATLLSTETMLAAPAGLAATVGTSALAAAGGALGATGTLATLHLMTTKLTIGILGALAVAATGGIIFERNANQKLLETNAALTRELSDRANAATAATSRAASAPIRNASANPSAGTAETPPSSATPPSQKASASATDITTTPQFQNQLAIEAMPLLDGRYGAFFKSQALTPEAIATLKRALIDRQLSARDAMELAAKGGRRADFQATEKIVNEATAAPTQDLKNLLGDAGYLQFRQYESTLQERTTVTQLQQSLSYTSEPLSEAQSDQLIQLIARNSATPGRFDIASGGPLFTADAAAITDQDIAQAADLLSPSQIQTMKNLQAAEKARKEMQQQVRLQRGN